MTNKGGFPAKIKKPKKGENKTPREAAQQNELLPYDYKEPCPKCKSTNHLTVGRPRVCLPSDEEMDCLGADLIAWVSEKIPKSEEIDRCMWGQWYSIKHGIRDHHWDDLKKHPNFAGYYEKASLYIRKRWINGTVHPSLAQRFLRHYFKIEVKQEENELAAYEYSLKKQAESVLSTEELAKFNKLMDQLSCLQKSKEKKKTK